MRPTPTEEQIAAAQLRIILDRKLGRETPELVLHIAAATAEPRAVEPEPAVPEPAEPEKVAPEPVRPAPEAAIPPASSSPLPAALGVELSDELLTLAMTHRSYAYEHGGLPPNERLEFLGDSILGSVVSDHLYRTHPDLPEGQLARLRASVVNMHALAVVARELGLGEHLLLGRGEELTGGRDKASILADTMEAVIGAVYLEHGPDTARRLVHRLLGPLLAAAPHLGPGLDWKTALVELTAQAGLGPPTIQVHEEGPDHRRFTATVTVGDGTQVRGTGRTRKEAEQEAAEFAYRTVSTQINREPGSSPG